MDPNHPWSRHRRHSSDVPGEPGARRHHPGPDFGPAFGPGAGRGGPWGWPGGRGPGSHGRGGRGRAGRGDVRLALLTLLAEEPMHGYQLMQAVEERTHGTWRLSPGAVYPTIAQLEDEGLVQVTAQGGRKLVTLTDAGRDHLAGLGAGDPFAGFAVDGDRVDLRSVIGELMGAVAQLGRVGDPAQLTAAAAVLADARRALYLILADAPTDRGDTSRQDDATD